MQQPVSIRITHLSWGRMEVCIGSERLQFQDCKVWPGGVQSWDWSTSGTHHEPGIQPAAVEEILAEDVDLVVLGLGFHARLGVCPETVEMLRCRGIEFYAEETPRAVERFNKLAEEGKRIGGLFHSTC